MRDWEKEFDNLDRTHGRIAWEKSIKPFITNALNQQRELLLKEIQPALDDFSKAGQAMIKDGRFVASGNEMIENVGFIKSKFLTKLEK